MGNHEIKVGGDYQKDTTFGSTFFTGAQRVRIRPCLQEAPPTSATWRRLPSTQRSPAKRQVFYQHDLLADGTTDDSIIDASLFNTPTKRYAGYIQDQWRIIPTLTINLGVRYDSEQFFGFSPDPRSASSRRSSINQWSPRVGIAWDSSGTAPRSCTVRSAASISLSDGLERPCLHGEFGGPDLQLRIQLDHPGRQAPRAQNFQGGSASGEPVDGWTNGVKNGTPLTKAAYQDELTLGVEKALDPTLSIGLKGTYRTLGRTVEDRCDLDCNGGSQHVRSLQPRRRWAGGVG